MKSPLPAMGTYNAFTGNLKRGGRVLNHFTGNYNTFRSGIHEAASTTALRRRMDLRGL
jgi:hypothetical protein